MLYYYYLNILVLFYTAPQTNAGACSTPEREQGQCVFVDDCPAIFKILTSNSTDDARSKYQCEEKYDSICCKEPKTSKVYGKELSDKSYCGYQHFDDYTSDRNETSLDEFPWLAAFFGTDLLTGKTEVVCQGSLINDRYVLTEASCFIGIYAQRYSITSVLLGEYDLSTETDCIQLDGYHEKECNMVEIFGIEQKIFHPFLDFQSKTNTIALIKLNRIVIYSDYIRPICLPIQDTKLARPGEILYTTGWGKSNYQSDRAIIKKKIRTVLQRPEECMIVYNNISSVHYLCTFDSTNNKDFSCFGDIGAPVTFSHRKQWHIEGIVSKGGRGCGTILPGVHIRVTSYLEWIKQNINL